MKIGILGVGYVGGELAKQLKDTYELTLFSRSPKPGFTLWNETFPDEIDLLIFSVAPDTPNDYEKTYLHNAELIAESSIPRIVYTSSTSVYGEQGGAEVTEETPVFPLNHSSEILIETEKTLQTSGKDVLILRLGEIIGPGREISKRLQNRTLIPGTGQNIVNLSPLADIVAAIKLGIKEPLSGIYNVVTDFHPTRKELYRSIAPHICWDNQTSVNPWGNKLVSSAKLLSKGFKFTPIINSL